MATNAPEVVVRGSSDAINVDFKAGTGQDSSVLPTDVAVNTDHLPPHGDVDPAFATPLESTRAVLTQQEDRDVKFVATTAQGVSQSPLQSDSASVQAITSSIEQVSGCSESGGRQPSRSANLADLVQSLDGSASHNGHSDDTSVAVPYEPTTTSEGRDDQPPRPPTAATRPFILRRNRKTALPQPSGTNGSADRYDYLKKYPEDPPEEALGPNARVWRVYLDEAEQFDIDMVDGFKDTVDVMLVFAGLFSAVVTTFVVQASTALQLDYNQVIASVLIEQLQIQRAIASGQPAPGPLPQTLNLESTTTTVLDRWANGLWFVSLSFSLATALFAVLVKQWIQSYVSPVSGSPQTRVRVRQHRFVGLEKWHVPLIVGLLPNLLHFSLLLFLLGLVVFLFALDHAIAAVTASIATVIYLIYAVANLAPLFNTQCPYKTPLSTYAFLLLQSSIPRLRALSQPIVHLVHTASHPITITVRHTSGAREFLWACIRPLRRKARQLKRTLTSRLKKVYEHCSRHLHRPSSDSPHSIHNSDPQPKQGTRTSGSMKDRELEDITAQGDATDAKALCWVVASSSNPSVKVVVVEAAGDLRIGYQEQAKAILWHGGVADAACRLGTYFSLLMRPSWESTRPQHVLQSSRLSSPGHETAFLHTLRRAALYLRTNSSSRFGGDMIDWPSCEKLLLFFQLGPHQSGLSLLWQTTLVSVYLASLLPEVSKVPISEDSGLLFELLFNQIELGSAELPEKPAIKLSVESCMKFLEHTLKNQTTSTGSGGSRPFNRQLEHLDRSEKHGASISAGLRTLIYHMGFNLMAIYEPQPSDVPLLRHLLRAALVPPQLPESYDLLRLQIDCLRTVLRDSPAEVRSDLTDSFMAYDGIAILHKITQDPGWQLQWDDRARIQSTLEFYLTEVFPIEEKSPPSPEIDVTQHGGQTDANRPDHFSYILGHLVQVIRTFVTCYNGPIVEWDSNSFPETLNVLRLLLKNQHETSPRLLHELEDLENQGFALPVSEWTLYSEHNLQQIISILRSDLEVARSPRTQNSFQPEPSLPRRSSIPEVTQTNPGLSLESVMARESRHPPNHIESLLFSRFRTAAWRTTAAHRNMPLIPLHASPLAEQVRKSEHDDMSEEESPVPRRDEEEGLPVTDPRAR